MQRLEHLAMLCLALIAPLVNAKDIAGGNDHPLVSRFAGSQLDGFEDIGYGQGQFYLPGKDEPKKELDRDSPVAIEGKVTRLLYLAPKGKSPLEVHRNYEKALQSAGATIKTSVNGTNAWWEPSLHWRMNFTQMAFQDRWAVDISPFSREGFYVYGVLKKGADLWHISVLTGQVFGETEPMAAVAVQIIAPVAMAAGQVTINADALKQGLSADGKVALYGIYFDTGKADIKPESKPQLEQMAKLLRDQASLKVFIVGHTDNQGKFETNATLSQRRAEAVVAVLTSEHKIDRSRLIAKGAANISPVASNNADAGRAKNRRVELVEQ